MIAIMYLTCFYSSGTTPLLLSDEYNNRVEEPEDEVVSYKTETDQESTRTDSRASEVSSVNSANQASSSILLHSSSTNGISKVVNSSEDLLGDSVIVRDHDESSSSAYDDDIEVETHSDTSGQKKSVADSKKVRGRGNFRSTKWKQNTVDAADSSSQIERRKGIQRTNVKRNKVDDTPSEESPLKLVLEVETMNYSKCVQGNSKQVIQKKRGKQMAIDQSQTISPNTCASYQQSDKKLNLAMSPAVIIKTLNLKHNNINQKISSSPINKATTNKGSPSEKLTKQKTINAYFSPPPKKAIGEDAATLNSTKSSLPTENVVKATESEQKLSNIKSNTLNENRENNERRRSMRAKTERNFSANDGSSTNTPYDSAESEISEYESEKNDEIGTDSEDFNSKVDAPFIISKRGRKIGRPKYIYESSSEHTSDAEGGRIASSSTGK